MTWPYLILIAVLFITAESVLEKKTLTVARTLEFASLFAICNVFFSLPLLYVSDFTNVNYGMVLLVFLSAIPSAGASLLIFKSLKHNELSEVAPLFASLPLIVTLAAYIFLGEKVLAIQVFGMVLMTVGIFILEINNFKNDDGIFKKGRGKYIAYIFFSLILTTLSALLDRIILFKFKFNISTYLILTHFFIASFFVSIFCLKPSWLKNLFKTFKEYWKIIILISFLTVIHRYLYITAIQIATSVGLVIAIYKLSELTSIIAGGKFFSEKNITRKVLAGLIILVGASLLI